MELFQYGLNLSPDSGRMQFQAFITVQLEWGLDQGGNGGPGGPDDPTAEVVIYRVTPRVTFPQIDD